MNITKFVPNANRFLLQVLFVLAAIGCCHFIVSGIWKIPYRYMMNLGEGALSQAVLLLSQGENPYHDLRVPPYSLVPYGPVYPALAAALRSIWQMPFAGGRLLTYLATLGAAVGIYRLVRRSEAGRLASGSAAMFFLCNPYVVRWGIQVNVDMSGVMLSLAAFYFFLDVLLKEEGDGGKLPWQGIVLCVTAFFTKTSMLTCPAAFFLSLCLRSRIKQALRFALITGGSIAACYTALNALTGGFYFFHTTYEISKRIFFWQFIRDNWRNAGVDMPLLVVATVCFIGRAFIRRKADPVVLYLGLCLVSTLSMGKQGSDTNYLLEWCAVASLAAGILFDRWLRISGGGSVLRERTKGLASTAAMTLFVVQCARWVLPVPDVAVSIRATREAEAFYDGVSRLIQRAPGKILSEDTGLLVANGREIFFEPFPMAQMSYSGVWDQTPILEVLDRRGFSMAILYFYAPPLIKSRTFSQAFMEKFNERYQYMAMVPLPGQQKSARPTSYYFYRPKTDEEIARDRTVPKRNRSKVLYGGLPAGKTI